VLINVPSVSVQLLMRKRVNSRGVESLAEGITGGCGGIRYVGQGMIMGPRTTLSMLAGALVGYAWLGPSVREAGWAPGPIQDWQTGASGWVLWISLAVMLGDSLTSLALLTASYAVSCARQWMHKRPYTHVQTGESHSQESVCPTMHHCSDVLLCSYFMSFTM
jgi:uncharacterized oligopeptide transporter (OPT) family protein